MAREWNEDKYFKHRDYFDETLTALQNSAIGASPEKRDAFYNAMQDKWDDMN